MTPITGNTYPVRDQLRALGGQWDGRARAWYVPDDLAEKARAIVRSAGNTRHREPRRRYVSTVTTFSSGATIYRNRAGRCEDAPCCGCCS